MQAHRAPGVPTSLLEKLKLPEAEHGSTQSPNGARYFLVRGLLRAKLQKLPKKPRPLLKVQLP
jgi:hypothetical protein